MSRLKFRGARFVVGMFGAVALVSAASAADVQLQYNDAHPVAGSSSPRQVVMPHAYWWHGVHDGRVGWWWVVGGVWYFYPVSTYRYMPMSYWCANPPGYFPLVRSCNVQWQAVSAGTAPPSVVVPQQ